MSLSLLLSLSLSLSLSSVPKLFRKCSGAAYASVPEQARSWNIPLGTFPEMRVLLFRNRPVLGTSPRNIPGNAYASVPGTFLRAVLRTFLKLFEDRRAEASGN